MIGGHVSALPYDVINLDMNFRRINFRLCSLRLVPSLPQKQDGDALKKMSIKRHSIPDYDMLEPGETLAWSVRPDEGCIQTVSGGDKRQDPVGRISHAPPARHRKKAHPNWHLDLLVG